MKITLLVIGKIRGPYAELCAEYAKRMTVPFIVRELTAPTPQAEGVALLASIPAKAHVVLWDETGKDLTSRDMATIWTRWMESGGTELVHIIGGADGVSEAVVARANEIHSLGHKTWPHKLARVMVIEQLYRAQQIAAGHPYHRD